MPILEKEAVVGFRLFYRNFNLRKNDNSLLSMSLIFKANYLDWSYSKCLNIL